MLWFDFIDIIYLVIGVLLGYIVCCLIHHDLLQDECDRCEYRRVIQEMIDHETE